MNDLQTRIHIQRAYKLLDASDPFNADIEARKALKVSPRNPDVLRVLGSIAAMKNDLAEAASYFKKTIALRPREPILQWELARVRSSQGQLDEAIACYEKALKLSPGFHRAITGKAQVLEVRGEYDEARAVLQPFIDEGTESSGMAVVYIRIEQHDGEYEAGIERAARHLADPEVDPVAKVHLYRLQARAYERLGRYDAAFAAYEQSNQSMAVPFRRKEYRERIDALIATFSAQNMPQLKRSRIRSERPIFIACMPRSGSTLVEQIVQSHPKAYGAGEITTLERIVATLQESIESFQTYPACVADLTETHLDRLAKSYLDALRRLDRTATRVTNKNLGNYQQLAMIELLFPEARVIHIHRDPMDNCFSCFIAALSPAQAPFTADLAQMGFAYREYQRLMEHWHEVLSIPILDVSYEALVAEPEPWIRKIIDFCGLEWDDRCLHFHESGRDVITLSYDQVRRPIYKTAIKRYEKYDEFLGPLRAALAGQDAADAT
ncbi:MAG: tetratricopeptide repeat protein [Phycisphaerales bacterium]|nr:sulfotransferase [Phycisphaerae bacterium]NNM26129.1 tetratricopeptide repeat protein [Phycisphaerales bacterium]